MYQGSAVAQKAAMATGRKQRRALGHRRVSNAQKKIVAHAKTIAAGPLARTASPRKKPKPRSASHGVCGRMGVSALRVRSRMMAAHTMAIENVAAKGMS